MLVKDKHTFLITKHKQLHFTFWKQLLQYVQNIMRKVK